jgi:hypothetical protein
VFQLLGKAYETKFLMSIGKTHKNIMILRTYAENYAGNTVENRNSFDGQASGNP